MVQAIAATDALSWIRSRVMNSTQLLRFNVPVWLVDVHPTWLFFTSAALNY